MRIFDHRSKVLIDERGWREKVANALSPPGYSRMVPAMPPGPVYGEYQYTPHPDSNYQHRYGYYEPSSVSNFPSAPPFAVPPVRPPHPDSETQAKDPLKAKDEKPATSEVRFTLPHRDSRPSPAIVPNPSPHISPQAKKTELQTALDKLELLNKKKDQAEQSTSDLTYYAIPELQGRIEKLRKVQQEDKTKYPATKKPDPAPHTEVETDSESSDGSEDLQDKFGSSDGDG